MKKILSLFLAVLFSATTFSQSDLIIGSNSRKVNKEKKNTWGLAFEFKNANYSFNSEGFDCEPGYGGELKWLFTGFLNPTNQESRWMSEFSLGLSFYTGGSAKHRENRYRGSDDIFSVEMLNMNLRFKYILNRYSNSGKWFIYPGLNICPLTIGLPVVEGERYKLHLGTGELGVTIGLNAGVGYQMEHWYFTVGGHANLTAAYGGDSSETPSFYGFTTSLSYLF